MKIITATRAAALGLAISFGMVTGCANQNAAQVTSAVISDIGLIASGLGAAVPALASSNAVPASTMATISQVVAQIQASSAQVQPGVTLAAAQTGIKQIETLLNTLVSAAASVPALPQDFRNALTAATVLLPIAEVAVGIVQNQVAPAAGSMTPDEARATLRRR